MLAIDPEHDRALGNKIYYEKELLKEAERNADRMLRGDDGSEELDEQPPKPHTSRHQDYERMCRNDYPQDQKMLAKLKCRYKRDNAFLQLAPLKYEEASLAPYIVVFHEVMGDTEIEVIKQLAKPKVCTNVANFSLLALDLTNYSHLPSIACDGVAAVPSCHRAK